MRLRRKVKIFLDDERITPPGYIRAYSYNDAIRLLRRCKGRVAVMSFDHDLGLIDGATTWNDLAPTGYDVLCWIEKRVAHGDTKIAPAAMDIHSANPVGRANMQRAIDSIGRLLTNAS